MNDERIIYWFDENFTAHEDIGIVRSNGTVYLVKKYRTISSYCFSTDINDFYAKIRLAIKSEINKRENTISNLKDILDKVKKDKLSF